MRNRLLASFFILTLFGAQANASGPVLKIESTITGNQEQPRVLSILPWQEDDKPDFMVIEIDSGLEGESGSQELYSTETEVRKKAKEGFSLIDRDSFNLELKYINATRIK